MNDDQAHFVKLAKGFDTAMLCTRSPFGMLRSRPMSVAEIEEGGRMWFVTSAEAGKVEEIADHSEVNVVMQSPTAYLSLTGRGYTVRDLEKVKALWDEAWRVWFPDGPEEADLLLIRVDPTIGEYWDEHGAVGVRTLWEAAKAYTQGPQVEEDDEGLPSDAHRKVEL